MKVGSLDVERVRVLWMGRTEKERTLMTLAAALLIPLLLYSLVWYPLAARVAHLRHALPRQRAALVVMRREALALRSLRSHQGHAPTGTALLSFVEQKAQTYAIASALSQLSPRGSHKAEVVFSKVPFNALVRFLAGLGRHGVAVARVELGPAGVGLVSGSLTLKAAT